jgi:hypothetical protein
MQRLVQEHDKTYIEAGQAWYIVDKVWLQSWLSFVHEKQRVICVGVGVGVGWWVGEWVDGSLMSMKRRG